MSRSSHKLKTRMSTAFSFLQSIHQMEVANETKGEEKEKLQAETDRKATKILTRGVLPFTRMEVKTVKNNLMKHFTILPHIQVTKFEKRR